MTPGRLAEVLGAPPVPRGTWEREALYVSTAALRQGGRAGERAEGLALRLRALSGIEEVRVRPGGFLEIVVAVPGELVAEAGADPADPAVAGAPGAARRVRSRPGPRSRPGRRAPGTTPGSSSGTRTRGRSPYGAGRRSWAWRGCSGRSSWRTGGTGRCSGRWRRRRAGG
ncbi:hypothetical protein [Planomonospora algeriensis]